MAETTVAERALHPEPGSKPPPEPLAVVRGKGQRGIPSFGFGFRRISGGRWNDPMPVREELFGIERLKQHAATLALAQPVTKRPLPVQYLADIEDGNRSDFARKMLDGPAKAAFKALPELHPELG